MSKLREMIKRVIKEEKYGANITRQWPAEVYSQFEKLTGPERKKIEQLTDCPAHYLSGCTFDDLDPETKSKVWREMKKMGKVSEK